MRNRGQSYDLMFFHAMENFSAIFPRYGKKFSTPWKTSPSARRPQDVKVGTARCAVRAVSPAVRRTWHQRISFGFGRGCSAPYDYVLSRVRRPQDVDAEDFFRVLAGSHAKIRRDFSDDDALRTTRTGLVSVRCRPQRARAEKARLGFRAAKTRKKSSLPSPQPTRHPHPSNHSIIPTFHHSIPQGLP